MERRLPIRIAVAAAAVLAMALPLRYLAAARAAEVEKAPRKAAARPAPAFTLEPRTEVLEERGNYPCTDCHDNTTQKSNPKERELEEEHDDIAFPHGSGRFWCLNCHSALERDSLVDIKGRKISFDDSHQVCLQCHSERAQDFARGGHGKRLASWQGERVLQTCVECHNPHAPAIKARMPVAQPLLRKGLPAPEQHGAHERSKPWDAFRAARGWAEAAAQPAAEPVADGDAGADDEDEEDSE